MHGGRRRSNRPTVNWVTEAAGRAGSVLLTGHGTAADRLHLLRLLDHRAAVAAADRYQVADEAALNALLRAHLSTDKQTD